MKISTILTSLFLVWSAYDSNLFRRRSGAVVASSISVSLEDEAEAAAAEEVKQLKRRHGLDVIPPTYRRPPANVRMKVNHFSGQTPDPRYSDQRKIRRRINNM